MKIVNTEIKKKGDFVLSSKKITAIKVMIDNYFNTHGEKSVKIKKTPLLSTS